MRGRQGVYVVLKLVYPLVSRIRARWVWNKGGRYYIYMKLDPVKVRWIIEQKQKGCTSRRIAQSVGVSPLWVKVLWRRYRKTGLIPELMKPGRRRVESSEVERQVICKARTTYPVGAAILDRECVES